MERSSTVALIFRRAKSVEDIQHWFLCITCSVVAFTLYRRYVFSATVIKLYQSTESVLSSGDGEWLECSFGIVCIILLFAKDVTRNEIAVFMRLFNNISWALRVKVWTCMTLCASSIGIKLIEASLILNVDQSARPCWFCDW